MDFTVTCDCAAVLMTATDGQLIAWRKMCALLAKIICPNCGCEYNLADGTTQINIVNVSRPRIDSINTPTGSKAGGTTIIVTGHALDLAGLIIKFAGKNGTNLRDVTKTSATIDTPAGRVRLNTQGLVRRKLLTVNVVGGPFQVGEIITGSTSGKTALVREVVGNNTFVYVDTWTGEFSNGETLTGGTSGATATAGIFKSGFQVGEVITGVTSGHTSTLVTIAVAAFTVDAPSGGYTAAEFISGIISEAKIRLTANHYDGVVDVEVENTNGRREDGGKLVGAFNYT